MPRTNIEQNSFSSWIPMFCLLWMALFSWVPIFVDWSKFTHSWGSKQKKYRGMFETQKVRRFVVMVFSFIIHTENCYFIGTEIRGSDPPRKPQKLVPGTNTLPVGTKRKLSHPQYKINFHILVKFKKQNCRMFHIGIYVRLMISMRPYIPARHSIDWLHAVTK